MTNLPTWQDIANIATRRHMGRGDVVGNECDRESVQIAQSFELFQFNRSFGSN